MIISELLSETARFELGWCLAWNKLTLITNSTGYERVWSVNFMTLRVGSLLLATEQILQWLLTTLSLKNLEQDAVQIIPINSNHFVYNFSTNSKLKVLWAMLFSVAFFE